MEMELFKARFGALEKMGTWENKGTMLHNKMEK